jgi:hypothetical protein
MGLSVTEWFDKGEKHLKRDEFDKAIEAFTFALSIDNNHEQTCFERGNTYLQLK